MYVLYKTFSKPLCNRLSNYFFPNKKTVLCREEIYFRIFLFCKTRFRYFLYRTTLYQCNSLPYIQTAHQPVLQ